MSDVDLNAQGDISVGGDVTGRDKIVSAGGDVVGRDKITAQQGSAVAGEGGIASVGDDNVSVVGGQGSSHSTRGCVCCCYRD
jgi:hypothetical protein